MIKTDPNYGGFAASNHLSERERQSLLSATLKNTMDFMQQQLESLRPPSISHDRYVKFCQKVISLLRAFTNNIRPVTDFFIRHSIHYWPKGDDPHLYAAGIISYSLRLHDQQGKTSLELFHYLYSGWKNDQLHSRVNNHITCVLKGMKNWPFAEFMLANFVPATVLAGFNSAGGRVLPKIYLPAIAKRTPHFLERNGPEGASAFAHLINILKMIMNGIRIRALSARVPERIFWDDETTSMNIEDGVSGENRGVISMACQFWISIQPVLIEYVEKHPAEMSILEEVATPLNDFMWKAAYWVSQKQWDGWDTWDGNQLDVKAGDFVERFVVALQEDMENHWMVGRLDEFVTVKVTGAREGGITKVSLAEGVPTLNEVLKLGISYFGGVDQETLDSQLGETKDLRFPNRMKGYRVEKFPGVFRGFF
jgi:hypothetical protein